NAALKASASDPLPNRYAIYFVRTSPIRLETSVETISRIVAVEAVCAREGRSTPSTRFHIDSGAGRAISPVEPSSITDLDFTWTQSSPNPPQTFGSPRSLVLGPGIAQKPGAPSMARLCFCAMGGIA